MFRNKIQIFFHGSFEDCPPLFGHKIVSFVPSSLLLLCCCTNTYYSKCVWVWCRRVCACFRLNPARSLDEALLEGVMLQVVGAHCCFAVLVLWTAVSFATRKLLRLYYMIPCLWKYLTKFVLSSSSSRTNESKNLCSVGPRNHRCCCITLRIMNLCTKYTAKTRRELIIPEDILVQSRRLMIRGV